RMQGLRHGLAEQHELKLKEKDKLIDELRRALDDARRKRGWGRSLD
ncbi:MAG: hypothetical protein JO358_02645, partial [Alphaproteobacteria bacterium]|nr:hypothetical protein [Alphaproteobacteria bacterium]